MLPWTYHMCPTSRSWQTDLLTLCPPTGRCWPATPPCPSSSPPTWTWATWWSWSCAGRRTLSGQAGGAAVRSTSANCALSPGRPSPSEFSVPNTESCSAGCFSDHLCNVLLCDCRVIFSSREGEFVYLVRGGDAGEFVKMKEDNMTRKEKL